MDNKNVISIDKTSSPHSSVVNFLNDYVNKFADLNICVQALVLFGSQARGSATLSSDIDIAVVMHNSLTRAEKGKLRCFGCEIDERVKVDLFFTTKEAIDNANGAFDTNKYIKEEGIVIWQK